MSRQRRPRVAMFLLNPANSDARPRKEAASLGAAGYDVRIFALGNSSFPAAVVDEDMFSVERIEVQSRYQRILTGFARIRHQRPVGAPTRRRTRSRRRRRARRPVRRAFVALSPVVLLPVVVLRVVLRLVAYVVAAVGRDSDVAASWLLAACATAVTWAGHVLGIHGTEPMRARARARARERTRRHVRATRQELAALRRWSPREELLLLRRDAGALERAARRRAARMPRPLTRKLRASSRKVARVVRAFARDVARLLRRWGREVTRALRRWRTHAYLALYRFGRRRLRFLHRPSVQLQFWKHAAEAAAAWRPDVVHAHDLNTLPAAVRVGRRLGVPVVYDSHELWRRRNRSGRLMPLGRLVDAVQERRHIRRVALTITVSHSIDEWLRRRYHLRRRTMVLRNVPIRRIPPAPPSLRELAGISDERILLYTGRITTGRGIEEAVDALRSLPPDVVFLLLGYGDDEYVSGIVKRAATAGVADRVIVVDAVPSEYVPAVASQADVALVAIQPVCLSYRFSLPNKLFEAIQAGVPVVASNLPDIARVVSGYGLGMLFDPGDAGQLRRSIEAILAEPELFRQAARRAAEELCWERESGLLIDAYGTLVPRRSPAEVAATAP